MLLSHKVTNSPQFNQDFLLFRLEVLHLKKVPGQPGWSFTVSCHKLTHPTAAPPIWEMRTPDCTLVLLSLLGTSAVLEELAQHLPTVYLLGELRLVE